MLKSTYRTAPATTESPLPTGWTEHKAPTGHTYYYNAQTKQSTYTRPVAEPEELLIDYNATAPDQVTQASIKVLDEFHKNNPDAQRGQGQFTGGRTYQDRSRRDKRQDRPKTKKPITGCEPWVLVMTKFGRRFVHNTDTKESLWKFPSEVMMAVIEMERVDWEKKQQDKEKSVELSKEREAVEKAGPQVTELQKDAPQHEAYDSDEYEEVEVTDDEADDNQTAKRPRTDAEEQAVPKGPVEYDEDDIAWQLAQMEEEGYDQDEYEEGAAEEDEEGLPLTDDDSIALFRSLLDEARINPFSDFEALIENNSPTIVEDDRWVALPNMSSRREAFKNWSRDRIADHKASEAVTAATERKKDSRTAYLEFLQENATPKLYWPEFKRKFKKEPEMKDLNVSDKDREKLYREYITKIKVSESDRKKEFLALLRSIPQGMTWNRRTKVDDMPDSLLKDIRFYVIRDRRTRDELVEAHLATLKD